MATNKIAAFFDLDKTLIAKSSALAFSRPFFDEGLISRRALLKAAYTQLMFLVMPADHEQVEQLRKHVTEMCAGWDVEQISRIVDETLDDIVTPLIFSEASEVIAAHKDKGHDIILISASGTEVVGPIATLLGADHFAASTMQISDGKYNGNLEFYCYGKNKVVAIQELSTQYGYDLASCFAYSDSITDLPMLEAVGFPATVNPDKQLRKHAEKFNWPILEFTKPVAAERINKTIRNTNAAVAVGATVASAAVVGAAVTLGSLNRKKNSEK